MGIKSSDFSNIAHKIHNMKHAVIDGKTRIYETLQFRFIQAFGIACMHELKGFNQY